jgi:hypothetical protein
MELVVDETHPGTDERTRLGSGQRAGLAPLCPTRPRWLLVAAPHHQAEVLGAGGLLSSARQFWRPFDVCMEARS